jgi:anaerobic sulfite reductase subunit B
MSDTLKNPILPVACKILSVKKESGQEWTFRVETDVKAAPGQFLQLSIPKIGEAPISTSEQGPGWLEFTVRSVGRVTNVIFKKQAGDTLFLRGPYGNGWPLDKLAGKHLVVVAGGTGLAPVRSLLNKCAQEKGFVKSVDLICGFKNEAGIVFKEDLERWAGLNKENFRTIYALDKDAKPGWRVGMVPGFIKDVDYKSFGGDYALVIVGPPVMMHFAGLEAAKLGIPDEKIWMSFERRMSCAVGKCGHCRIDEVYVCLDGPVFNYTQAKYLTD